jgi:hypothetical protein
MNTVPLKRLNFFLHFGFRERNRARGHALTGTNNALIAI